MSPLPPVPRKKSGDFQAPRVVFQPKAVNGMQAGIHKIVALIRPTLGPLPHVVANESIANHNSAPELLDSGGTIARRVIQIAERDEDVGAMYLRHVLWKIQENEGDGTATAAVMFETVFDLGRRYVIAGGSPMILRQHLERGMRLLLDALDQQTTHLSGKQALSGLARTICYDNDLANMLGEIFDIIGAYGRLEVRENSGRELLREYVEGMYWDGGMRSREMANADFGLRANLENCAILISDLDIETPDQLVPLLTLALQNNIKQILLVSSTLSEKAMSLLLAKPNQERVHVVAVKAPGSTIDSQMDALEDLAILTGGKPLLRATGDLLEKVTLEHLGRSRRAWVDREYFGIVGGRGEPRTLRKHIAVLRENFRRNQNSDDRKRLLERLGKLTGGSAALMVGGNAPKSIEARVELAKRTATAMRGAMSDGVVLGGGLSLLNCRAAIEPCFKQAQDPDERAAYRILLQALETPFRTLAANGGFHVGRTLAEMEALGPEFGLDVIARRVLNLREAALFDAAPVVKSALRGAISGAALALTTEAIVHRKNPPEEYNT